jgi:predicted RNA-binding Zn-ribbon protein involved in translation (DUF1610 family)
MSRYRLSPTPRQEIGLPEHCAHARFVWNLACEQHAQWCPCRATAPNYNEQARQLTEARAEFVWLRAGSVENLPIRGMTRSAKGTAERPGRNVRQKAGLNRGILASGWGQLVTRLEHKASGRVEKIRAAYTSQRCSACGHVASDNRKSQAEFRCVACGFACNADVNAACNIAAGQAVTARGALQPLGGAVNREPQLTASAP